MCVDQFWEWLQGKGDGDNMTGKVGGHTHNSWSEVVEFVQTTPNALDILLVHYKHVHVHVH